MTTALIDGDIIAFRAAAKVQDMFDGEAVADPRVAIREADHLIEQWTKYIKPNLTYICLSCPSRVYFRHDIYPEYKANRKELQRPPALSDVINHLREKYKCLVHTGLEADDVMGYYGTSPDLHNPVIVSIDKDMMTVPTKVLNPDKMRRPIRINKGQADLLMFKQAITGDSTDNYKGIPGIGTVKADKILSNSMQNGIWNSVLQAFLDNKLTTEYALTMVRLARILRYEDYDVETGEIYLWHPVSREKMIPSSARNTTNSEMESKSSTSSKLYAEDSPETKPSISEMSSSTSADTETKKTDTRRRTTSRKRSGTSTEQENELKKKETEDADT